jgi:hypothetical protein
MLVKQLNENHYITMVDSNTPNRERTTKDPNREATMLVSETNLTMFENQLNEIRCQT